ncbi:alpha/beta hydrolase [Paraglaciecola sp. 20A4]|uniref:alpha/beta fold hydrolase n=1 Tax=Paraglaciecola sp. 20A4 TaxID=2687288 RepID=UPI00140745A4|nr:alpha/beta hydrolase [Paraglaciecola sp. 20A4]
MKNYLCLICLAMTLFGCSKQQNVDKLTQPKSHLGFASQTISINELTIHYVEKGSGELILFLHGFPYFGESWFKLLDVFGEQYHAVAPDNRGYGYSEKPEEVDAYHIEKLVSDVEQLIHKLSPYNKVILVGHDWGGGVAWALGQTHPELISKLIVINGIPPNAFLNVLDQSALQRERSQYIERLDGWMAKLMFAVRGADLIWKGAARLHENGHVDDRFKQAFLTAWEQPGAAQAAINWYSANIPAFDQIQEADYWPSETARISVPSLLIRSKEDPAFTEDAFDAVGHYVDNLTIKVIDTDSHVPFIDHSEEVIKYMQEFIQGK